MKNSELTIVNMNEVLTNPSLFPTLTRYNRLESRPRSNDFQRAMRAEVRDALWMLCKQWQMGEFLGDDAGSPVEAKIAVQREPITKYKPANGEAQEFDFDTPLEATVEKRSIPFESDGIPISLDLRLQLGRRWLKMIPADIRGKYKNHYSIQKLNPLLKENAAICAHAEVWQQFQAVADGRAMDGYALYLHLKRNPLNLASDGLTNSLTQIEKDIVDEEGPKFVKWFEKFYLQPQTAHGDAWLPERLEYQFNCAVGPEETEKVLSVEEYYHGRLDWYNFDWDKDQPFLKINKSIGLLEEKSGEYLKQGFIPAPVRFNGMPDPRWWTLEDGKINFADIKPGPTDLAKLLLIEFGLVYANDWFILPYTVPSGSVLNIQGLSVTNTFGERFWIQPAGRGLDAKDRWSMYTLNIKGEDPNEPADLSLLMLPTVPKIQESPPLEQIVLIRDEMANMVWGIEQTILTPSGWTRTGNIAAAEYQEYLQMLYDGSDDSALATINWKASFRYELMNSVPENWIPFVPQHMGNSRRQIQLRRAAMPRLYKNDPHPNFERIRPRTSLLRHNLDAKQPFYLYEEEVPRAGIKVTQTYQRTRWNNGQVFVWLGTKKSTARGEGSSGLAFDRIIKTESD